MVQPCRGATSCYIWLYNIILCIVTVTCLVHADVLVSDECDQIVYNLGMRYITRSDMFVHENV